MFFVPCLCSLFFIWFYRTKTRSETKNNNNTNTTTDTHNKNKGQPPNNKHNEQCQHNFGEQKKIKKKQEIIQAELMLFLSFIVCFCCILCVAGCVLSFEFLILVLMVWYFFFFFVLFQCSCSLFHIRVLCVSFDC